MKSSGLLPWVGWNTGRPSFASLEERRLGRAVLEGISTCGDSFVEVTKLWWERFAASENWQSAAELGKLCARKRPKVSYGWENWAWSLHKQGKTREAYDLLAPMLKRLKLPGPPSGRAAYCLACFCGAMDQTREGTRWLRLAWTMAADRDAFRIQALLEPELRGI